jgi:drug/metabolite transporter (DMT)-like permease
MATGRFFDKTLVDHNLDVAAPPVLYALVVNAPTVVVGLVILTFTRQVRCLPLLVKSRWQVAFSLTLLGQGAFLLALMSLDYFPPSVIEPVTQLGVFIAVYLGGRWFGEKVRTRWLPSAMVVAGAALLLI